MAKRYVCNVERVGDCLQDWQSDVDMLENVVLEGEAISQKQQSVRQGAVGEEALRSLLEFVLLRTLDDEVVKLILLPFVLGIEQLDTLCDGLF